DTLNEPDETFQVTLSQPANAALGRSQGIGTILNDDALPSLSVNDVQVLEGNSGTTQAVFTVTLSAASGQSVSIHYATADGTATAPSDYQNQIGNLVSSPGQTIKPFSVTIEGDTLNEPDETFFLNLGQPTNAGLSKAQGLGTILNDDPPPSLSINDVQVLEGN